MSTWSPALRSDLASVAATVAYPEDEAYAQLVAPWNLAVPTTPGAVVAAVDAAEVANAVQLAGANGVPVAVQCTGHGAAADLTDTILVSTRGLTEVTIHAEERWARVGAGVAWKAVLDAAAAHGLAALAGSSPGVGVVGYTTGGGHGPIARSHGLASDRVRAFEVVTGDGQLRRTSANVQPDLFWALRGGKGTAGIVTAIEFDLLPIPSLYAGALYVDGAHAETLLTAWSRWCPGLPPEATTSIAVLQLPEMPGVPKPLAGRATVAVRFAWTGDPAGGAAVLAPMRAAAPLLIDGVSEIPYAALGMIHSDPVDPVPSLDHHAPLTGFGEDAARALLAVAGPGTGSPQIMVEVRQLGGALTAEPGVPSAFSHRDVAYGVYAVGIGAPPVRDAVAAHGAALRRAMEPWAARYAMPNFLPGVGEDRFGQVYPDQVLERLRTVARAYDPNRIMLAADGLY